MRLEPAVATAAFALNTIPMYVTQATSLGARILGLTVLAGTVTTIAAVTFRWYTREGIPDVLALLIGLATVAMYLNTTTALGQAIGTGVELSEQRTVAMFHLAAFLSAGAGSLAGRKIGDDFGTEVVLRSRSSALEEEVGRLVETVGRVITVYLPENVDDIVGYDPVPDATKAAISGKRFIFPRKLTVEELRRRIIARLKADYGVGHVDLELADDGRIEYLAVGSRAAGIGPTLPPATNAVAVKADPGFAASTGDLVQLWATEPLQRVLTAELRGVAGDVVTLAIDSSDTPLVDPRQDYRLVSLPVDDRPEREFASLLRMADETFDSVTVEAGSPIHGLPVGALDVPFIAVHQETGDRVVLPKDEYLFLPGDRIFAIARPERLRRLDRATASLDPTLVDSPRPTTSTTSDVSEPPHTDSPETDHPFSGSEGVDESRLEGSERLVPGGDTSEELQDTDYGGRESGEKTAESFGFDADEYDDSEFVQETETDFDQSRLPRETETDFDADREEHERSNDQAGDDGSNADREGDKGSNTDQDGDDGSYGDVREGKHSTEDVDGAETTEEGVGESSAESRQSEPGEEDEDED